jgi:crossover junction endodeoxyribonuclease RuvC
MITLGIDPGITGAVAVLNGDELVDIIDMPTVQMKSGKTLKNFINPPALAAAIKPYLAFDQARAFIEDVGAMPGQGVTSMFRFGYAAGLAAGVIAGLEVPFHLVRPQVWQPFVRLARQDPDAGRMRASQLFPKQVKYFARKMDHNRADATLIALFGSKQI